VPVRALSDRHSSARRRTISTFICPSREFLVCLALAKDLVSDDLCGIMP